MKFKNCFAQLLNAWTPDLLVVPLWIDCTSQRRAGSKLGPIGAISSSSLAHVASWSLQGASGSGSGWCSGPIVSWYGNTWWTRLSGLQQSWWSRNWSVSRVRSGVVVSPIFLLIKTRMPQILIESLKLEPPLTPGIQADLKTLRKVLLKAQCFPKASQN